MHLVIISPLGIDLCFLEQSGFGPITPSDTQKDAYNVSMPIGWILQQTTNLDFLIDAKRNIRASLFSAPGMIGSAIVPWRAFVLHSDGEGKTNVFLRGNLCQRFEFRDAALQWLNCHYPEWNNPIGYWDIP